jgi:cardiolipin synthase
MLTVPNVITVARTLLIPVIAYFVSERSYAVALLLFVAAALGDGLDGFIARRFNQISRFGAVLDPIADKLTLLAMVLLLAWQLLIPAWLAAAIVARDLIIVSGALAYRLLIGPLRIAPTLLSKLNTLLEFVLVAVVLAGAAGWVDVRAWVSLLFLVVFLTVALSGINYVWVWAWKAAKAARRG